METISMPRIYEEIRQAKPFRRPEHLVTVTVYRTADVLAHAVDRAMAPFGLSSEQYNVLRILRGAGAAGLPTLEIAHRMVSRSPNITRMLDKLISKKLVRRIRSRTDRRVVVISIVEPGLKLLVQLDAALEGAFAQFPALSQHEVRTLVDLLDRIRERLAVKTVKEAFRNS